MGILCLLRLEVTAELWYKLWAALWMVVEGRSEQSEPRHSCCCSSCSLFLQHLCWDYSWEVIFILLDVLRHPLHLIISFWILLGWVVGILCVGYMNFKLKCIIMRSFCHQATNDACSFDVLTKCQSTWPQLSQMNKHFKQIANSGSINQSLSDHMYPCVWSWQI